ncbi:MAG: hypothetical protein GQE15_23290 [Archangiaceae bacterium]|nr:hypothetical protein [Archangiaceae bacterium]
MSGPRWWWSPLFFTLACGSSATPPDTRAPGAPTNQRATVDSDGSVSLSWTSSPDGDFARTLLARFPPGGRARRPDGTPAVGDPIGMDGTVLFLGTASAFVDRSAPVTCGVVSYRLWSQDTQGRWSDDIALVELDAGITTPPPTQPVTSLTASAQSGALFVNWTNPSASSGFSETRLVKKAGSAPASLTDGSLVLSTSFTQYVESLRGQVSGSRLFFAAFTCNACGRCQAMPATVSFTVP